MSSSEYGNPLGFYIGNLDPDEEEETRPNDQFDSGDYDDNKDVVNPEWDEEHAAFIKEALAIRELEFNRSESSTPKETEPAEDETDDIPFN